MSRNLKHLEIRARKLVPDAHMVRINGRGPSIRLHSPPESPEYFAEYAEALRVLKSGETSLDKRLKANKHHIKDLLNLFEESKALRGLKPTSRKTYKTHLNLIRKRFGEIRFEDLTRKDILEALDDLSEHTANTFLSVLRRVIHWATLRELVNTDPTIGIKGPRRPKLGFPAWGQEQIYKYQTRWPVGTQERLALDLLNYTGLRVSDIIELGPSHIKNGYISKVCNKNGVKVKLPLHPALARSIKKTTTGDTTFLCMKRHDRPFADSNYFGSWFKKACKEANIDNPGPVRDVTAHGLRKTAAIRAIKKGATTNQAMAFQGWNDRTMLDHYVQEIDREQVGATHGHMIFPDEE